MKRLHWLALLMVLPSILWASDDVCGLPLDRKKDSEGEFFLPPTPKRNLECTSPLSSSSRSHRASSETGSVEASFLSHDREADSVLLGQRWNNILTLSFELLRFEGVLGSSDDHEFCEKLLREGVDALPLADSSKRELVIERIFQALGVNDYPPSLEKASKKWLKSIQDQFEDRLTEARKRCAE